MSDLSWYQGSAGYHFLARLCVPWRKMALQAKQRSQDVQAAQSHPVTSFDQFILCALYYLLSDLNKVDVEDLTVRVLIAFKIN